MQRQSGDIIQPLRARLGRESSERADIVWVIGKGDSCDPFTKNDAGRTPASQASMPINSDLQDRREVQQLFARQLATLEPRSASDCSIVLMSTACWPPAVSLRITPAGSLHVAPPSSPSRCSAVCSAVNSSLDSRPRFRQAHSSSTDISYPWRSRAPSPPGCDHGSRAVGAVC